MNNRPDKQHTQKWATFTSSLTAELQNIFSTLETHLGQEVTVMIHHHLWSCQSQICSKCLSKNRSWKLICFSLSSDFTFSTFTCLLSVAFFALFEIFPSPLPPNIPPLTHKPIFPLSLPLLCLQPVEPIRPRKRGAFSPCRVAAFPCCP